MQNDGVTIESDPVDLGLAGIICFGANANSTNIKAAHLILFDGVAWMVTCLGMAFEL